MATNTGKPSVKTQMAPLVCISLHSIICAERSINLLGLESLPPQGRKDAVRPVVGGDVQRAEHLRRRDRFGVHPHLPVGGSAL